MELEYHFKGVRLVDDLYPRAIVRIAPSDASWPHDAALPIVEVTLPITTSLSSSLDELRTASIAAARSAVNWSAIQAWVDAQALPPAATDDPM